MPFPMLARKLLKSPLGIRFPMSRTRYQEGWVHEHRLKSGIQWRGEYYVYETDSEGKEKRRHKTAILGWKAGMTKTEAKAELRQAIATAAKPKPKHAEPITLKWFWENRYKPMRNGKIAESSFENLCWIMDDHIVPGLGAKLLTELNKFDCQSFLDSLSDKGLSRSAVSKAKTYLGASLTEAVGMDFIEKNPAIGLEMKTDRTPPQAKVFLSLDHIRELFNVLTGRDRLILQLFLVCGFRRGEFFALKWNDWTSGRLAIDEALWRKKFNIPKSATSKAPAYLPPLIEKGLADWKKTTPGLPTDFIFPGVFNAWMSPDAWMKNNLNAAVIAINLKKKEGEIPLPHINYQVLRRTSSTHMQNCGTVKDAQRLMRHAKPDLTADVYMQVIDENVKQAVNLLEHNLFGWIEEAEKHQKV